jgi:3-keto-5-aminohexanoate cleavage enzyme
MGVKNALPARREILEFEVKQLNALLPDASWTAAGIGRHQLEVNHWTLEMGGHCRTGLEDNVRWDKDTLAKSNAQLVSRVVTLCGEYEREVASAAKAREILGLLPL